MSGEYVGYIGIEVVVQNGENIFFFEVVLVGLLLVVFKFSFVFGFIISGIQVVYVCFEVGIYDG